MVSTLYILFATLWLGKDVLFWPCDTWMYLSRWIETNKNDRCFFEVESLQKYQRWFYEIFHGGNPQSSLKFTVTPSLPKPIMVISLTEIGSYIHVQFHKYIAKLFTLAFARETDILSKSTCIKNRWRLRWLSDLQLGDSPLFVSERIQVPKNSDMIFATKMRGSKRMHYSILCWGAWTIEGWKRSSSINPAFSVKIGEFGAATKWN